MTINNIVLPKKRIKQSSYSQSLKSTKLPKFWSKETFFIRRSMVFMLMGIVSLMFFAAILKG